MLMVETINESRHMTIVLRLPCLRVTALWGWSIGFWRVIRVQHQRFLEMSSHKVCAVVLT